MRLSLALPARSGHRPFLAPGGPDPAQPAARGRSGAREVEDAVSRGRARGSVRPRTAAGRGRPYADPAVALAAPAPTTAFAQFDRAHTRDAATPLRATSASAEPLAGLEWWRAAIGADRADPPGPGKPVTIVDSGLDISHPEFAGRPNTTLLNTQTTRAEDDDHGTEVGSVVAAPENGVGLVGVYPQVDLRSWDASPN